MTVWSSRRALVFAALALLVIKQVVPFGRLLLYPFTLLATWVHEMGHGLAALVVGGHFSSLQIFSDASGLAQTSEAPGAREGVVAIAGLLAPPIVGASILAFARGPKRARTALGVLAIAMLVSLAIWVRSIAGFVAIPIVCALVAYGALKLSENHRLWLAQFLGVFLALDTVSRIDYLFTRAVMVDGEERASDIANAARAWGGFFWLWGLLVAAVSLALVAIGLWAAWRASSPPRAERAKKIAPAGSRTVR